MAAPASLTLADVDAAAERVAGCVVVTPSVPWDGPELAERLVEGTSVVLKLELLQRTGSFKARGALLNVLALDDEARRRGVTAISAGNHAVAVAWGGIHGEAALRREAPDAFVEHAEELLAVL